METKNNELIWGFLIHLGYRMWADTPVLSREEIDKLYADAEKDDSIVIDPENFAADYSQHDDAFFDELTQKIADSGCNMVVIDLGEGVRYDSAPELAMEGTWSKAKLADELARLRRLGLEPIPKLNFSTCHDLWLGDYARMVSSRPYYKVCADIIAEVCELFDKPRFFHIGFDEEYYEIQSGWEHIVCRQGELWYRDLNFLVNEVEKNGSRAWMWSEKYCSDPERFLNEVPRSVMHMPWHYTKFDESLDRFDDPRLQQIFDFENEGLEQVVGGSNWADRENIGQLVRYFGSRVSNKSLKGFLQTVWRPILPYWRSVHFDALELFANAKKEFETARKA